MEMDSMPGLEVKVKVEEDIGLEGRHIVISKGLA